ncbi:MAG TPA: YeeE/YedE family protein [Hyphomicrobiaceae bacterium]|nr:YeeE/YedE family protein [Hyphomicrobiaceae bacterium]
MALRELIAENAPVALSAGGLLIGFLFGAIVFKTNFCTMGSISDIVSFGDYRRFRAWVLAAVTALVGAQLLQLSGVVELTRSMYLSPNVNWFGHVLGGLMFGYGMVFAGGCPSRNLARVGGGDLRSLVALIVIGIFAFMTIGGILGPIRAWLEQSTAVSLAGLGAPSQSIGDVLSVSLGLDASTAALIATIGVAVAALAYCFGDENFRTSPVHIASGIGIGLCVIAGWALTGLAFDEMADRPVAPISLTFVRPAGDTLEWLQRYTALGLPGFGVATVFGAILGSFVTAVAMKRFTLTTFSDKGDTIRVLSGAALMGVGGVMALGCTVGQGITGVSTLAIGSFISFAAIVTGGVIGMKAFERMLMAEA